MVVRFARIKAVQTAPANHDAIRLGYDDWMPRGTAGEPGPAFRRRPERGFKRCHAIGDALVVNRADRFGVAIESRSNDHCYHDEINVQISESNVKLELRRATV